MTIYLNSGLNGQQLKRTLTVLVFPNTQSQEFPVKIFYNRKLQDQKASQQRSLRPGSQTYFRGLSNIIMHEMMVSILSHGNICHMDILLFDFHVQSGTVRFLTLHTESFENVSFILVMVTLES